LETLNAQLAVHLAAEADKIENLWERAAYLYKRMDDTLWAAAVTKYVTDTDFPLLNTSSQRWSAVKVFKLPVTDLATKFNISIKGFMKSRGTNSCQSLKADSVHDMVKTVLTYEWQIRAEMDRFFVFNDTKVGALERAKFHWRNRQSAVYTEVVYVLEPVDRALPMKQAEFLAEIMNPPANNVMMASTLIAKERTAGMSRNVSILRLETRSRNWRDNDKTVWVEAGTADSFSDADTYYYVPLSGFSSLGKVADTKLLSRHLSSSGIYTGQIYGVRKGDIEAVKAMSNWIPLDTLVES
jgi:hypothetical protein